MGNSEILQKRIDEHVAIYGYRADHDTHELYREVAGLSFLAGSYEIEEGDVKPIDNSITINFETTFGLLGVPSLRIGL